jgi:acetoin utilization deacetylase AcuC-like enzyme
MALLRTQFPHLRHEEAPQATEEHLLLYHTSEHVEHMKKLCVQASKHKVGSKKGLVQVDPDTTLMPLSEEAMMRAAGSVIRAVDDIMQGTASNVFCCVRPPGHHAEPHRAMGFCFYNNVPIGCMYAREKYGIGRVAVIDWDVHHGNGTQEGFKSMPFAFYASTHQGYGFYPGTGWEEEIGEHSNILNVMLKEGAGSDEFRAAYSDKILPALREFEPELIFISAGFDAHELDPLASIELHESDYAWLTGEICGVAREVCNGRVISVLEGGYHLEALALSAAAHVGELLRQNVVENLADGSYDGSRQDFEEILHEDDPQADYTPYI